MMIRMSAPSKSRLTCGVVGTVMLGAALLFMGCSKKQTEPTVGGACRYDSHAGQARIVSINADEQSDAVDVKFVFLPSTPIKSDFFHPEKRYTMHTSDSKQPTKAFVQANDLKTDKMVEAEIQLITEGACTPVLFNFPALTEP